MKRKKRSHKQSKFLTIMLVPDSAAKVKSLKAPRWSFYAVTVIMGCIFCVAAFSLIRLSFVQKRTQQPPTQIEAPQQAAETGNSDTTKTGAPENQINEMREAFEDEKTRMLDDFAKQLEEMDPDNGDFAALESVFSGLQNKSRIIEDYKLEIMNVLDYLDDDNMHYAYYESLFNIEMIPMGGPGVPEEYSVEEFLYDYDEKLGEMISELRILKITVEGLLPIVDTMPSGWPVDGREILSYFGRRPNPFSGYGYEIHYGVDIEAPAGAPVYATAGGVVEYSDFSGEGFGNMVVLAHEYGYSTSYAHNSELLVSEGDTVSRGDVIALAGNSGRSTGAHCHYEVKLNGVNLDPLGFLVEAFG